MFGSWSCALSPALQTLLPGSFSKASPAQKKAHPRARGHVLHGGTSCPSVLSTGATCTPALEAAPPAVDATGQVWARPLGKPRAEVGGPSGAGFGQCQGEVPENRGLSRRERLAGLGQQQEGWGLTSVAWRGQKEGHGPHTPHHPPPPRPSPPPPSPAPPPSATPPTLTPPLINHAVSSPNTRWRSPPRPAWLLAARWERWMELVAGPPKQSQRGQHPTLCTPLS